MIGNELETTPVAATSDDVDGAVGVVAPEPTAKKYWYIAIVNPRHEMRVAERLTEQNVTAYVASQKERRIWRNGRHKMVDRIVIPSMVFIRCTETERRQIVTLPYINRFLTDRAIDNGTMRAPVARISDREIEKLRFMLGQTEMPVTFDPTLLRVHDNVRIIRGNLRGLTGEVMETTDGTSLIKISLSLLGGATLRIDPSSLLPI